jgi:hypothetical protein
MPDEAQQIVPGFGDPFLDREPGHPGMIDPDEPTEGIRLLH